MLKTRWRCDVCCMENVCDVPSEMHFFAVILVAKSDHERISPSCEQTKIHGWLLRPQAQSPNTLQ